MNRFEELREVNPTCPICHCYLKLDTASGGKHGWSKRYLYLYYDCKECEFSIIIRSKK